MKREQFTFYESFFNAINRIKKKADRADAYDVICRYALYGIEPELDTLPDAAAMAYIFSKPVLDASRRKAESGKKGGERKQGEHKQTGSKQEANRKQEKEQVKEQEQGKEQMLLSPLPLAGEAPHTGERPRRTKYGQYGWVKLTQEEYDRLLRDLGPAELDRCITYIDESAQGNGNKNGWKDWNLVVRRCHREGWGIPKLTSGSAPGTAVQPSVERIRKNADWMDAFLAEQGGLNDG